MDRRTFIAGATGFGLLGAARAFAGTQTPPRLRFGVISDLHLKDAKSRARYARALRWFDAQRADAVLCCGDLTDWGLSHQLKMVADTWRAVFPGDRRSDGAPIARLFLYGDHDNGGYAHHHFGSFEAAQRLYGFTAAEVEAMAIRQSGAARRWEEAFGEAYEPIFVREVKGYRFVLANFTMDGGAANPRGDNTPGAEARLAALARDPSKPFFYAQHRVYRGTMGGTEMTGLDDGRATAMLAQHPNCVAFCGHAHRTLTDEKMIWQGAFTAVEAPSLAYVTQANGRENARTIDEARARQGVTPLLPTYPMTVPEQGLLVSVWDDQISFERRDFHCDARLGAAWTLPLGAAAAQPYAPEARAAAMPAPRFPAGARAVVTRGANENREREPIDQYRVSFPAAVSTATSPRALDYEVRAFVGAAATPAVTRLVYSDRCARPEAEETLPVVCPFAVDEFPVGAHVRFEVRARNAFGRCGAPLEVAG